MAKEKVLSPCGFLKPQEKLVERNHLLEEMLQHQPPASLDTSLPVVRELSQEVLRLRQLLIQEERAGFAFRCDLTIQMATVSPTCWKSSSNSEKRISDCNESYISPWKRSPVSKRQIFRQSASVHNSHPLDSSSSGNGR
jgi:hypothetical protein